MRFRFLLPLALVELTPITAHAQWYDYRSGGTGSICFSLFVPIRGAACLTDGLPAFKGDPR
jgi:hypothetical protein